ncbi:MAG: Rieske 2Fe-2S domain-containing protein [Gemmatimonadota bacterium]|nr:Rieske 2Fe-2S domain-containing protein [Gemmatimonadota bacterium]
MSDSNLPGGCAGCLTRRDFLGRVALVAGAVIAAGCGGASDLTVGTGPITGGAITFKSADYAGLAAAGQPVEVRTTTGTASGIAVVRTSASTFLALSMACTHQGTKVRIAGQIFDCPNHGAQFNSSGAVTLGPATRALAQRTVGYDAATDTITVS